MGGLWFLFVIGFYVFIAYEAVTAAKNRWVKVIALTAAQNGIAVRYALHALSPFVLYGADYTALSAGGAFDLVDYANHSGERLADLPSAANDYEWRGAA